MSPRSRLLLIVCALVGLGAAAASAYVHYQLLTTPNYTSVCDINATWNCSQVYLSRYGSFGGVPVALGGLLYFVVVLLLAGPGGAPGSRVRETAAGYVFALSTLALAFVLYLGWAMFFELTARCFLCLITYASVIAIFVFSGGAVSFPMTHLPRRAARDVKTLLTSPVPLVVTLLFVIGAATLLAAFPREGGAPEAAGAAGSAPQGSVPTLTEQQRTDLAAWLNVQPVVDVPVPREGAKVLIVKFSDFQCPACRQAHDAYKHVLARYSPGDVKFVLKHFPLEPECNGGVPQGNHFASCEAAAAMVMAGASGNAAKMKDWLFANQPSLAPSVVKDAAKSVAGIDDFDARYPAALQEIREDAALGAKVQVSSTPTFFVNGRKIVGVVPPQYFDGIIQLELERAK